MNINHYLYNENMMNHLPGLCVALDLDSRFLAANNTALAWTGYKSKDLMLGTTYCDMPCKASEQHENFRNQDKIILKNDGYGKIFGLYCYNNDDWKIILAEKFPIKDEKNNIIALMSYITDLTDTNMIDINKFVNITLTNTSHKISQNGLLIGDVEKKMNLTTRQTECLFFILRGKTAKEIACILELSKRTIETFIDQLKDKFNVQSKSELISKALCLGYMNTLPKSLFDLFIKR